MKFLYFTRSNGDVDSRPDNLNIDTAKKRRDEIGDKGASKFSVQDSVLYPVWNGSKYVSNTEEIKNKAKQDLKSSRNEQLENITVEVNGNVFQSRKSDEINFRLAIGSMADGDTEEWILDDDSIVEVTKEELQQAYVLGLTEGKRIFAEYKKALKEL